jgi:hypothetical protein
MKFYERMHCSYMRLIDSSERKLVALFGKLVIGTLVTLNASL